MGHSERIIVQDVEEDLYDGQVGGRPLIDDSHSMDDVVGSAETTGEVDWGEIDGT